MTKPMRVAIVGCGGIAKLHASSIAVLDDADLVALCDVVPASLAEFGKTFDVPSDAHYTDYERMYDTVRPDIVAVCTRPVDHAAPSIAALNRGINVLCEKPMGLDLKQADAMIAASERSGAKLAVDTQRHTDPVWREVVKLVKRGEIGDLRTIRSECKTYRAGYGMLDIGAHYLDVMSLFAGPPRWVFASFANKRGDEIGPQDVEPGERDSGLVAGEAVTIHIGYDKGVVGLSEYWVGTTTFGFEIVGTKGAITVREGDLTVMITHGGGGKARDPIGWEPVQIDLTEEERRSIEKPGRWSTANMMRALMKAIREDSVPACSGYDGRTALEIIMATWASARAKARVDLPLTDRRHPLSTW